MISLKLLPETITIPYYNERHLSFSEENTSKPAISQFISHMKFVDLPLRY